jgi:hypothetical protein
MSDKDWEIREARRHELEDIQHAETLERRAVVLEVGGAGEAMRLNFDGARSAIETNTAQRDFWAAHNALTREWVAVAKAQTAAFDRMAAAFESMANK